MTDLAQLGKILGEKVLELLSPLKARLEALEKRAPEKGDKGDSIKGDQGERGADGKSVTLEEVSELIVQNVELLRGVKGDKGDSIKGDQGERGETIKGDKGDPGKDGKDGESVTMEQVQELVVAYFSANVDKLRGADGKDGKNGADGQSIKGDQGEKGDAIKGDKGDKGDSGKDGQDGKSITKQEVEAAVAAYFAANIEKLRGDAGTNGKDGKDGKDGQSVKGERGERGEKGDAIKGDKGDPGEGIKGERGADGKSVTMEDVQVWLEASFAKWALDVERRMIAMAEKAIERLPAPRDGKDGIGVASFEFDADSCMLLAKTADEKVIRFRLPVPQYKGIWRAQSYEKGNMLTLAGSMWIALRDAEGSDKPGTSDAWQQCVKKGRDGRDK